MERRVKNHQYHTSGISVLIQKWNKIEFSVLEKLVDSISSRIKNYPSKYSLSFIQLLFMKLNYFFLFVRIIFQVTVRWS